MPRPLQQSQSNASLEYPSVSSLKYVSAIGPSTGAKADDLISKGGQTTASLAYLSQLSQSVGEHARVRATELDTRVPRPFDQSDSSYKTSIRTFMDKKLQRDLATSSVSSISRVFRERQSRRMFEELQQLKSSCARTYEELETMHAEVLLGRSRGV